MNPAIYTLTAFVVTAVVAAFVFEAVRRSRRLVEETNRELARSREAYYAALVADGLVLEHELQDVKGWLTVRRDAIRLRRLNRYLRSHPSRPAGDHAGLGIADCSAGCVPGDQGRDWLDEAKDHLIAVAEDGGSTQRTRRGLFMALMTLTLPVAWYREVRRKVLRRWRDRAGGLGGVRRRDGRRRGARSGRRGSARARRGDRPGDREQ